MRPSFPVRPVFEGAKLAALSPLRKTFPPQVTSHTDGPTAAMLQQSEGPPRSSQVQGPPSFDLKRPASVAASITPVLAGSTTMSRTEVAVPAAPLRVAGFDQVMPPSLEV